MRGCGLDAQLILRSGVERAKPPAAGYLPGASLCQASSRAQDGTWSVALIAPWRASSRGGRASKRERSLEARSLRIFFLVAGPRFFLPLPFGRGKSYIRCHLPHAK